MISWKGDDDAAPTPEQLAAYADGELDGHPGLEPLRRRIETWLTQHPDDAAEVEAQRRLTRLWQVTTPPEPTEAAWQDVLERLRHTPRTPPAEPRRRGVARLALWMGAAVAASAAVVWLALALFGPGPERALVRQAPRNLGKQERPHDPPRPVPEAVEPFLVATADEVEILSIKGADTETVLVGELPVSGPLVMADRGEVELARPQPEVRMGDSPPMVWAPIEKDRSDP